MKIQQYTEFWYEIVLGGVTGGLAIPILIACQDIFNDHSHGAIIGWVVAVIALILLFMVGSCFGWQIIFLKRRKLWPGALETLSFAVFFGGLISVVLAAGMVIRI